MQLALHKRRSILIDIIQGDMLYLRVGCLVQSRLHRGPWSSLIPLFVALGQVMSIVKTHIHVGVHDAVSVRIKFDLRSYRVLSEGDPRSGVFLTL